MPATNNNQKRRMDEHLARIALAAGSPGKAETCPDIETLQALIEDPGQCRDRDAIFAHLARCEACYQQWVDLSKAYASDTVHAKRRTIVKMIARPRYLAAVGSTLAVAASVLLYLGIPSEQLHRATVGQESGGMEAPYDSTANTTETELTESESDGLQIDRLRRVYSGREDAMDEAEPVDKPHGLLPPSVPSPSESLELSDRDTAQREELSAGTDEEQSLLKGAASSAQAGAANEADKKNSSGAPTSSATTMDDTVEDSFRTQGVFDNELGASLNEPTGGGAAAPAPVVAEPQVRGTAPPSILDSATGGSRLKEDQVEFDAASSPNMSARAIEEQVMSEAGEYRAYPGFIDHLRLLCTRELPPTADEMEAIREEAQMLMGDTAMIEADRAYLHTLIDMLDKEKREPQAFARLCEQLSDGEAGD